VTLFYRLDVTEVEFGSGNWCVFGSFFCHSKENDEKYVWTSEKGSYRTTEKTA